MIRSLIFNDNIIVTTIEMYFVTPVQLLAYFLFLWKVSSRFNCFVLETAPFHPLSIVPTE